MIKKAQSVYAERKRNVFENNNLASLIGSEHAKVFKYDFGRMDKIETYKIGNKFVAGFLNHDFINGIGFSYLIRGQHGGFNP